MKFEISYSNRADKFIRKQKIEDEVKNAIKKFIQKYSGEDINIDVKKMKGVWQSYHRIKTGKLRIILKVEKEINQIIIDTVDYRGDIY